MARIKINDLPNDTAIGKEELGKILGGSISDAALIIMSQACADMEGDLKNAAAQINVMHEVMNKYRSYLRGFPDSGDDEGGSIL